MPRYFFHVYHDQPDLDYEGEELPSLQELVDIVRTVEGRLSTLESKGKPHPTEAMAHPNRK
jgi:hypothetical protein